MGNTPGITPIESKDGFRHNIFMTFRYDDQGSIRSFGSIITQKAFDTFIGSNQFDDARLIEEDITFPDYLLGGSTRRALVHYTGGKKFAAYVPAFPTEQELDDYDKAKGIIK